MRQRFVVKVLGVFAMAVVALAVPSGAASGALPEACHTTVVKTTMSPVRTVVGARAVKTSTYTVVLDNNCDNPGLFVNLASTDDVVGQNITMNSPSTDGKGRYTFTGSTSWDPATMNNAQYAGTWISVIDVFSDNGPSLSSLGADFSVLRATTVTAKTSAVATKGTLIPVTGRLTRANWDSGTNVHYVGQRADLQFKTPTGVYTTIKSSRSTSNGFLFNFVQANADGCFRYLYRGNATTVSSASSAACVDVR